MLPQVTKMRDIFSDLTIIYMDPRGLYMDQNRNKLEKACSRLNFPEKQFGAIDSREPGAFNHRGRIIRKKLENELSSKVSVPTFSPRTVTFKFGTTLLRIHESSNCIVIKNETLSFTGRPVKVILGH